jgi:hypothetical protein
MRHVEAWVSDTGEMPVVIVLSGSCSGPKWERLIAGRKDVGQLIGPAKVQIPASRPYACDNDVFAHRGDPDWWCREGESNWRKMLDKIPSDNPPLFVLLPDVVADAEETRRRARQYIGEVRCRGLRPAYALQDGCAVEDPFEVGVETVFVGGSRAWKWRNVERLTEFYRARGVWVHVGRVSGPNRLREVIRVGAQSCDGTGWARHTDKMLPGLFRVLDGTDPQVRMELV